MVRETFIGIYLKLQDALDFHCIFFVNILCDYYDIWERISVMFFVLEGGAAVVVPFAFEAIILLLNVSRDESGYRT